MSARPQGGHCGDCAHFAGGPRELERAVPGLAILSSALGSVRADTGLCRLHDRFCVPEQGCGEWEARAPKAGMAKPAN